MCATQRSGSTLLCELLKGTGVAGCPEEFFEAEYETGLPPHPGEYLEGLPRTGAGIRDDLTPAEGPAYSSLEGVTDYRRHLERALAWGTTPNGVFGAKLMWNQIAELQAHVGPLPEYARPRAVRAPHPPVRGSALRLGRAPRQGRPGGQPVEGAADPQLAPRLGRERPELHYRYTGIDHLVQLFHAHDRAWDGFFAAHGIEPLQISYEDDLERDQEAAVRQVLDFLGVRAPDGWKPAAPLERQADALSAEWVAAYHRDRARHEQPSDEAAAAAR